MDDHRITGRPAHTPTLPDGRQPPPRPPRPAGMIDLDRPAWRLVLTLVWPALLQQLLIFLVAFSDRFLAGHNEQLDPAQRVSTQAAQTTANYLAWFISSYSMLVSVGSTALVARFLGAGDRRSAAHAANQSLLLAAGLGLVGTVAGLAGLPSLMALLGLEGETAAYAVAYLWPVFALLTFQVVESAGIACLVGAGDTRTGLCVLGGVAVLNVPLAWGFCWGVGPVPGLGFQGIAVGTAVSHTLGALAVVAVLVRGRVGLRLRAEMLWPDWGLLRRLLRVSVPAGADSLSVAVGQLWFLSIVNGLGDAAKAAHGLALNWEALGYLSGGAFGTAAMALVGQNLGAGRPAGAARGGWTALAMGGALMTLMGAVFYTFAPEMFGLFCPDAGQQPIIDAGVPVLRLIAFAMPPLASCIVFTYALRGAGDTRVPVLFTWLGFFAVRIPLAYLLTRPAVGMGLMGAWLAMFADIVVRGAFFLARFAGGRWQRMRV